MHEKKVSHFSVEPVGAYTDLELALDHVTELEANIFRVSTKRKRNGSRTFRKSYHKFNEGRIGRSANW